MVTGVNGVNSAISKTINRMEQMKPEDFLKIMINQLQRQDPFEPTSAKDLIEQVGHVSDIQSSLVLVKTLRELAMNQKLSAASLLIGKLVVGISSEGEQISGLVTSVKREGESIFLELDSGARLSVDNVIEVHNND